MSRFKIGQRVRPSMNGIVANLFPGRTRDRGGIVVKVDQWNSPTIKWDGRKTTSGYAPWFIAPDRRKAKP